MRTERRACRRTGLNGSGVIVAANSPLRADCRVVDIGSGARIRLNENRLIPSEFDLVIENSIAVRARTVWRDAATLGVTFAIPHDAGDPKVVRLRR